MKRLDQFQFDNKKIDTQFSSSFKNVRPFSSHVVRNISTNFEQRISSKKLQKVQEWLNEQIIKKKPTSDSVNINIHYWFYFIARDFFNIG